MGPCGTPSETLRKPIHVTGFSRSSDRAARRCFLWRPSVSLVCRWTVIVGGGGPDVRPISSPHVQVFSLLCSAVCLHVSLNMMFSDTLGIFYSIYYICWYLWIFFFWQFFHWKYFCMFVFWNVISSYLCFSSFADWCINYTLNKFF